MDPRILKAILLLIPLIFIASDAAARWAYLHVRVTDEDMTIIKRTAREEMTGKPVGTVLSWSNPRSKLSGTVTLLERFEENGRECRRLKHHVSSSKGGTPWDGIVTICLQPDGKWKLKQQGAAQ